MILLTTKVQENKIDQQHIPPSTSPPPSHPPVSPSFSGRSIQNVTAKEAYVCSSTASSSISLTSNLLFTAPAAVTPAPFPFPFAVFELELLLLRGLDVVICSSSIKSSISSPSRPLSSHVSQHPQTTTKPQTQNTE
jgi:hypothetical protein